ncbi:mitotic checkpoint regulator, MAD2B-interacting-domain-containing protein [Schizophyllum amplum]|uniref:Mitotic checkpoint regulator, MAD2B-interacting-domain-containing protein n=1 Tax=Schizophyllum amplum TaxID=97359 RepID=A0A550BUJ1_9AGAR|nr:mitotic checkpoint regulator, MAD2B-interacting-domain-containing protein [Auriculariopsis ampla]
MALGLEGYGSGSDSDSDVEATPAMPTNKRPAPQSPSSSKLALPPPKASQPRTGTRKVKIGLPSLKPVADDEDDFESEKPPAKKPRLTPGAGGKSALLSMLPAPKEKNPKPPAPERVLGGGRGQGLVFHTRSSTSAVDVEADDADEQSASVPPPAASHSAPEPTPSASAPPSMFMPTSLKKGRANISLEEHGVSRSTAKPPVIPAAPVVDFFSLGSTSRTGAPSTSATSPSVFAIPSRSAAPEVPTFQPPEPTPNDPYPGYYQLPSGKWEAHDAEYYQRFYKKWQADYNAHVRALEKGQVRGFEDMDEAQMGEVDAAKEMERAKVEVKAREERKALSLGAASYTEQPKMKITASKLSGVARSRHQLATMLHEAYSNREALEEKIAEGRRNRKEAGNKYGF